MFVPSYPTLREYGVLAGEGAVRRSPQVWMHNPGCFAVELPGGHGLGLRPCEVLSAAQAEKTYAVMRTI